MTTRIVLIALISGCSALAQTTQPATSPARQSAEEMLSQMLRPTSQAAQPLQPLPDAGGGAVDRSTGAGAIAPEAPVMNLLPEGSLIVDRIGRLRRVQGTQSGEQGWELTLESDGRRMNDPPLLVLPNKILAQMKSTMIASNADLRFRVSGELTEFDGRNYILVQKAAVVPRID